MKNIFLVINKEKIYAYVVSLMTIVVIFFMSSLINSDLENAETASSNSIENVQSSEDTQALKNVSSPQITKESKNSETVETSGEIGEAISTSTPSDDVNNAVENN